MKKNCIIGLLAGICGLANVATATTINASLGSLPKEYLGGVHNTPYMEIGNGYEWGITSADLGGATSLASASISITATLYHESSGNIDSYLLNSSAISGLQKVNESVVTAGTLLGSQSYTEYTSATGTWTFDSTDLSALNADLASFGGFNLGFNPHCTYAITDVSFSYTTSSPQGTPTPDTATTVGLLGASLLGLEMFRRKLVPAKIQA